MKVKVKVTQLCQKYFELFYSLYMCLCGLCSVMSNSLQPHGFSMTINELFLLWTGFDRLWY